MDLNPLAKSQVHFLKNLESFNVKSQISSQI